MSPGRITIYTECTEPLEGWDEDWNKSIIYYPVGYASNPVFWGCELSQDKTYVVSFTKTANNITDSNATYGVNSPSREGFEFGGWYTNTSFTGKEYTTEELITAANLTYYAKWIPILSYTLLGDGTYEVSKGELPLKGEVILPTTYNGRAVTRIANNGFSGCDEITQVVIPFIIAIGFEAFSNCTALTWVEMPSTLIDIGAGAFSGCTSISEIIIPENVRTVRSNAFSGCLGLSVVALARTAEQGITEIATDAFNGSNLRYLRVFDEGSYNAYYDYFTTNDAQNLASKLQFIMYI